jgi:DNA-binding NarL/FixJ family response regulator
MKMILVGSPAERARMRTALNGAIGVVGEFPTLAAAEASGVQADGVMALYEVRARLQPDTTYEDGSEVVQEALTPREIEVLELLAEGLPNKTIAARLGISDQTVKFHVASISGKLGAANRTDAVRRAVRRGLITL